MAKAKYMCSSRLSGRVFAAVIRVRLDLDYSLL